MAFPIITSADFFLFVWWAISISFVCFFTYVLHKYRHLLLLKKWSSTLGLLVVLFFTLQIVHSFTNYGSLTQADGNIMPYNISILPDINNENNLVIAWSTQKPTIGYIRYRKINTNQWSQPIGNIFLFPKTYHRIHLPNGIEEDGYAFEIISEGKLFKTVDIQSQ